MRLIFSIFFSFLYLFGQNLDFSSIETDFSQSITSPEGSVIKYKGKFFAKKPNYVLWRYTYPMDKSIYFKEDKVMIVESELEQVIISKLPNTPNIQNLLAKAKKVSKNTYIASYQDTKYTIGIKNNKPSFISYKDKIDNKVKIIFSNTKTNLELKKSLFTFKIPKDYDIITQ